MNEENEDFKTFVEETNDVGSRLAEYLTINKVDPVAALGAMSRIIVGLFINGPLKNFDFVEYTRHLMLEYKNNKEKN